MYLELLSALRWRHLSCHEAFDSFPHRVSCAVKYYEGGLIIIWALALASLALLTIVWKIYRARAIMLRTVIYNDKEYYARIDKLYFLLTILTASVVGALIGNALYWFLREP